MFNDLGGSSATMTIGKFVVAVAARAHTEAPRMRKHNMGLPPERSVATTMSLLVVPLSGVLLRWSVIFTKSQVWAAAMRFY